MKNLLLFLAAIMSSLSLVAQPFDFANTSFYITVNPESAQLTTTGETLSSFNYNSASPDHPIFNGGIYFPVYDCADHNLWLRVKHVAADPNGTENGYNIGQTMNNPCYGGATQIGGWNGFLYDFQIFSDVSLDGNRLNELGGPYPIQIIVESLETLYNDGGTQFEWLSFEILNPESQGWQLMSTNFTGTNPQSTPGFSTDLHYTNQVPWGEAPEGFSTEFPAGSPTVYAVDLNLSPWYHSEFRMTAGAVTHFRYGYEFTSGGYQGMSMTFGGAPTILGNVTPQCGSDFNGSISVSTTGPIPFVFDWGNGITGNLLEGLAAGTYNVTLTDGSGCSSQASFEIPEAIPVYASLEVIPDANGVSLVVTPDGGNGEYAFEWSNGSTSDSIYITGSGTYDVTVSSGNGCSASLSYQYVGVEPHTTRPATVFPNPSQGICMLQATPNATFRITGIDGRCMQSGTVDASGKAQLSTRLWSPGLYHISLQSGQSAPQTLRFVIF